MDRLGKQPQAINMADHVDDHAYHMIQVTSRSRMNGGGTYKYVIADPTGEERRLSRRSFQQPTTEPCLKACQLPVCIILTLLGLVLVSRCLSVHGFRLTVFRSSADNIVSFPPQAHRSCRVILQGSGF